MLHSHIHVTLSLNKTLRSFKDRCSRPCGLPQWNPKRAPSRGLASSVPPAVPHPSPRRPWFLLTVPPREPSPRCPCSRLPPPSAHGCSVFSVAPRLGWSESCTCLLVDYLFPGLEGRGLVGFRHCCVWEAIKHSTRGQGLPLLDAGHHGAFLPC